jgi:hypothetical protein
MLDDPDQRINCRFILGCRLGDFQESPSVRLRLRVLLLNELSSLVIRLGFL